VDQRVTFRPVELPETGAYIRVDVDAKGYIRHLAVLKQPAVKHQPAAAAREETIARLVVLKAAANLLGHAQPDT
jgi:hypothetical protein